MFGFDIALCDSDTALSVDVDFLCCKDIRFRHGCHMFDLDESDMVPMLRAFWSLCCLI